MNNDESTIMSVISKLPDPNTYRYNRYRYVFAARNPVQIVRALDPPILRADRFADFYKVRNTDNTFSWVLDK